MAQEEPTYQPKDAIANALKATMITSGAGAFVSAIQNTLTKQNVTAWGVITRSGGTIAVFGMPYHICGNYNANSHSCDGRCLHIRKPCICKPEGEKR